MRKDDTSLEVTVNNGQAQYNITITKPVGFRRTKNGVKVTCDGNVLESTKVPFFTDGKEHEVKVEL